MVPTYLNSVSDINRKCGLKFYIKDLPWYRFYQFQSGHMQICKHYTHPVQILLPVQFLKTLPLEQSKIKARHWLIYNKNISGLQI